MTKVRIPIKDEASITWALMETKKQARAAGFKEHLCQMLATAASELGHNIIKYAVRGHITITLIAAGGRKGLELTARDGGPGIADIEQALQDHYSTSGTLGLGLPGIKRMVDEFEIHTNPGKGTTVTVRKWL